MVRTWNGSCVSVAVKKWRVGRVIIERGPSTGICTFVHCLCTCTHAYTFSGAGEREGQEIVHDDCKSSEALLRILLPSNHTQESNSLYI